MENSGHKIQYIDLSYQVYQKLKEMILAEEFKPGQKLLQEKIALMLGVSRTPLHKAFQMLEDELLVESIPRRGIFVRKLDMDEIIDTFECREVLEGLAAKRVASRITHEEINELRDIFEPYKGKTDIQIEDYHKADLAFHHKLISISQNRILQKMEIISNVMHKTNFHGLFRPPVETMAEHLQIIDAFEKKESVYAEKLMRDHLHKTVVALKIKYKYRETP